MRPGARTIGLLVDDTIASGVTPLLDWLDARDVNVEVRHAREFVEPEQALLVLQACDMIIAGSALQCLSIDRCRNLGLVWSAVDPRPVMIVPPENAAWVQAIASFL